MNAIEHSPHFNAEWLRVVRRSHSEGWRLDFKRGLIPVDTPEKKYEFAKHMIAFANVARRTGLPCFLIFGVDEDNNYEHNNILEQYLTNKRPKEQPGSRKWQKDRIEEIYRQVCKDWITPTIPDFELEWGYVEPGIFNSYLTIRPTVSSEPFALKNTYHGKQAGTVYVRKNTSSVEVEPSEVRVLLQESEAAYLEKIYWANLLEKFTSADFYTFSEIAAQIPQKSADQNEDLLTQVIAKLRDNKRIIMVVAKAGQGKTFFMHRLAYRLAQDCLPLSINSNFGQTGDEDILDEESVIRPNDLEVYPNGKVPIYFSLRIAFTNNSEFEKTLVGEICEKTGNRKIKSLCALFKIPGSRWVLLLDGLDELRNAEVSGPLLRTWVKGLPHNVQVVLTSRPNLQPGDLPDSVIWLQEPEDNQIANFIFNNIGEVHQSVEPVKKLLRTCPDLMFMVKNPRFLNGFISHLNESFVPVKTRQDQDQVTASVIQEYSTEKPIHHDRPPIIQEIDLLSDDTEPVDFPEHAGGDPIYSDINLAEPSWMMPSIGEIVRSLVQYMIGEEAKRQWEYAKKPERRIDRALGSLEKIAWNNNWNSIEFDPERFRISDESLWWCENIGFIDRLAYARWRFLCNLLYCYFAADYGFRQNEIKAADQVRGRMNGYQNSTTVLNLLNDLRISNGKSPISV